MGAATVIALTVGALAGAQSFMGAEAERGQKNYEAKVARANAEAMRQQADLEKRQGIAAQEEVDRERARLRRDYEATSGRNRSLLSSGNVALDSGSALDTLLGNADLFADDMGENRYRHEVVGWEVRRKAQLSNWQADVQDSQANWLKRTAGSLGTSLLTGAVTGTMAGLSTYAMAGGFGAAPGKEGLGHVFDGNRTGGVGGGWNRVALGTR
ncbi:hypothetical protein [Nitratidesulfovibrio vulgaris]|uniref:hypothetical protein n=1 Tax=Nitratidesulfovibrio vulgaris TaxID=881 RepID=UPI00230185C5|nr:hypothetical protein [Nitratidesulfovibrio vulgaris]WCB45281.1 hypothetical protein PH214_09310 [Nitratidesulfovibrio vulgaris]